MRASGQMVVNWREWGVEKWAAGRGSREAHSESLMNVPQLREMAVTSNLGKDKELGRRWRC